MGDRDVLLSQLSRWHAEQPWARTDPRHLDIAEVKNVGPLEVVLRTEHEVRGVEYQLSPAPRRDLSPPQAPDPWSASLALPAGAVVGQSVREPVGGHPVPLDCTTCSGSGELKCQRCDGRGTIQSGKHTYTCPTCGGRTVLRCDGCRGSGGMLGMPTLWAKLDVSEVRRTTDNAELPTEVAIDLADRKAPGDVVWRREAQAIDAAMLDSTLDPLARKLGEELLAAPGTATRCRLWKQTLEIRRMAVHEVRRISGATLYVWGDPPQLHPKNALASTLGRVLPFFTR